MRTNWWRHPRKPDTQVWDDWWPWPWYGVNNVFILNCDGCQVSVYILCVSGIFQVLGTCTFWMDSVVPLQLGNHCKAWISNHMPSKVWDEITYPFPIFNSCTVEVWEWISNFIPHFIMDIIPIHAGVDCDVLSWDPTVSDMKGCFNKPVSYCIVIKGINRMNVADLELMTSWYWILTQACLSILRRHEIKVSIL